MTLTMPIFEAPIVIPATANLIQFSGGEFVNVAAGVYYWGKDGTQAGTFCAALKAGFDAADSGSWDVELDNAVSRRALTLRWNSGALPTAITFLDMDVLSPYMLGLDPDPLEDTVSFGGGEEITGDLQPAWIWEPREYVLDDTATPQATTVVSRSISGAAIIDDYGEWAQREIRLEVVAGARVWMWAGADTAFALQAGLVVDEPHASLEALWRRCRTQPATDGAPLRLQYYRNAATWESGGEPTAILEWTDPEQMSDLRAAVEQVSPSPLLYRVRLRAREV